MLNANGANVHTHTHTHCKAAHPIAEEDEGERMMMMEVKFYYKRRFFTVALQADVQKWDYSDI